MNSHVRLDSKPRTPNETLAVVKAPWQTGRFSVAFGPCDVDPLSSSPTAAFRGPPRRQQSKWQRNVWQGNEYGRDSLAPIPLPRQAKIRQHASCRRWGSPRQRTCLNNLDCRFYCQCGKIVSGGKRGFAVDRSQEEHPRRTRRCTRVAKSRVRATLDHSSPPRDLGRSLD